MKKIRITITMTEQEAEWLEQACFVEEEFPHSKFLNRVSNLTRRARHAFQQSVHPTLLTEPVNYCNPVNGVHAPFCTGHKSQSG